MKRFQFLIILLDDTGNIYHEYDKTVYVLAANLKAARTIADTLGWRWECHNIPWDCRLAAGCGEVHPK